MRAFGSAASDITFSAPKRHVLWLWRVASAHVGNGVASAACRPR